MTPRELIEKWVVYFNNKDASALGALYADDAINHQVTNEPIVGKENIRAMFEGEFASILLGL